MSRAPNNAKARAEAGFKGPEDPSDSMATGRAVVEAERVAVAAKTNKLRALRLVKERSDEIAVSLRKARRER